MTSGGSNLSRAKWWMELRGVVGKKNTPDRPQDLSGEGTVNCHGMIRRVQRTIHVKPPLGSLTCFDVVPIEDVHNRTRV